MTRVKRSMMDHGLVNGRYNYWYTPITGMMEVDCRGVRLYLFIDQGTIINKTGIISISDNGVTCGVHTSIVVRYVCLKTDTTIVSERLEYMVKKKYDKILSLRLKNINMTDYIRELKRFKAWVNSITEYADSMISLIAIWYSPITMLYTLDHILWCTNATHTILKIVDICSVRDIDIPKVWNVTLQDLLVYINTPTPVPCGFNDVITRIYKDLSKIERSNNEFIHM